VPDKEERQLSFPELLQRLKVLLRPHWKKALIVAALLFVTLGFELALPIVIERATNNVRSIVAGSSGTSAVLRNITLFAILYLVLSAARLVMMYFTGVEQTKLTQEIMWALRRQLYQAMQRMSFSFFDREHSGQLISRVTRDVQRVAGFLNGTFFSSIEAITILGGITFYMFYKSPLLAVVALCTTPVMMYFVVTSATKMRNYWHHVGDVYGEVTTVLQENIAGIKVVRAFAKENEETRKFEGKAVSYIKSVFEAVYYWATRLPLATTFYGLNAPLILVVGGWLVIQGPENGGIELGTLFAFVLYTNNLSYRVEMVGNIVSSIAHTSGSADRIYEVLDARPEVAESPKARELPPGKGEVVFDGVTFGYVADKPVLRDVSLHVPPGSFIALVGHTGVGKTTLVSLIPRFYDVSAGSIRIDGADIRDLKLNSLRKNVALIFQETFLFSASVRENIAYGRPDATTGEIIACARAAQAHGFIEELDRGYDTIVGERGVTLSGGQRQRIAIARAILANPRILVMDDATASVDSATERLIQEALIELTRNRTTFVIAHRISTVRRADRIVVIEGGRIVETGAHNELLAARGAYRDVYEVQLAENQEGQP
jgi:ATP-binding cassette subfamily B protein